MDEEIFLSPSFMSYWVGYVYRAGLALSWRTENGNKTPIAHLGMNALSSDQQIQRPTAARALRLLTLTAM
jgi:hypothetical protein